MTRLPLAKFLMKNWWMLLLRGVLAVIFGVLAFVLPGLTLVALVFLYGAYALVDGVTALVVGGRAHEWWMTFAGLLGIAAGILTFIFPGLTAYWLLVLIASWAIVRGLFEIVTAIKLRKQLAEEWTLIFGGILSVLFGIFLLANPVAGAAALVWLIGSFAIVFGAMMIVFSFRLRALQDFKPVTV